MSAITSNVRYWVADVGWYLRYTWWAKTIAVSIILLAAAGGWWWSGHHNENGTATAAGTPSLTSECLSTSTEVKAIPVGGQITSEQIDALRNACPPDYVSAVIQSRQPAPQTATENPQGKP